MRIAAFLLVLGTMINAPYLTYAQCEDFECHIRPILPSCPNSTNGTLTIALEGGTPPYTYAWDTGEDTNTIENLSPGIYRYTITDANDCHILGIYQLKPMLSADILPDTTLFCDANTQLGQRYTDPRRLTFVDPPGSTTTFSDGVQDLLFEGLGGFVSSRPQSSDAPTQPNALQLTIESAVALAGEQVCMPITAKNFEGIDSFSFGVQFNSRFLSLDSIASPNTNLEGFSLSDHFILPSVGPNSGGVLTVNWADTSGMNPATLSEGDTLFQICFTVRSDLGNLLYTWGGPDGFSSDMLPTPAVSTEGMYSVTISNDSPAACGYEASTQLLKTDTLDLSLGDSIYVCENGLTISPELNDGFVAPTYAWNTGEQTPNIQVDISSPTTYAVTVSSGGCMGADSALLLPASSPIAAPIDDITLCDPSGLATVSANVNGGTPPYTYAWNGTVAGQTAQISPLGDFVFPSNLIVIDSLGCSDTTAFTIFADSFEMFFPIYTASLCAGTAQLAPVVTNTTGTPSYLWSTGDTSNTITVDSTGFYYVTVQNGSGCTLTDSILVADNELTVDVVIDDNTCSGGAEGCIIVQIGGGNSPYDYQWSDGQVGNLICNLPAGTYTVTVTDANGCQASITAEVSEPPPLDVIVIEDQAPTCPNSMDGELSLQVTGGTPPYFNTWSNGQNGTSVGGLNAGTYTVTVTDFNGCSVISQYLLEASSGNEIVADAGPDQTITCSSPTVVLDGNGSSLGPEYTYEWIGPFGEVYTDLSIVTSVPGQYILNVTNTNNPGCTATDMVIVMEDTEPPVVNLEYNLINCDSARITYTSSLPLANLTWNLPDGGNSTTDTIITASPGTFELAGQGTNGCDFFSTIELPPFPEGCITLQGQLRHDTLQNCQIEPDEPTLPDWLIAITGNGQTFYAVTQADGQYQQQVPEGQYELTPILPSNAWQLCQPSYTVNADTPEDTITQDLQVQSAPCADFEVSVGLPILRRCWERSINVHYRNIGAEEVENATLSVLLDEELTFISANAPLLDQDGQQLTFDIGDVPPNVSGTVQINVTVSCNAAVGEAICIEAKASPSVPCEPPSENWSGASLQVSTDCEGDEEVVFRIENVGDDMTQGQQYIVVEDGVMLLVMPDTVLLDAQESYEFRLPATGATYRLEAEQVPFHPEQSTPVAVLEGCGTDNFGSFSTGFVNQFDLGDEDTFIDIECGEIVAAYDPNDKNGYPLGHGPDRNIYPGTELEYRIRFQNTGNDTAFLVVIKDTIDTEVLDLTTVRPGVSSHDYTWDIEEESTLVFTFENILLPDSMTNELGSQGFVDFKIQQQPNLPLGTVIENRAGIYFDINPPIITNTSLHTLNRDFLEAITHTVSPALQEVELLVIPNPARERALIQLRHWPADGGWIELSDPLGRPVLRQRFDGQQIELERRNWPAGWYSFRVVTEQGAAMSGQMVWR